MTAQSHFGSTVFTGRLLLKCRIEELPRFGPVLRCVEGVTHGHIDGAMPKKLLDRHEVHPVHDEVKGKGMPAVI